MSKPSRNSRKTWVQKDIDSLEQLAKENTPTRVIWLKLGRTEDAIRSKSSELDVSLKPTNQSTYDWK
jgi:hypothetical protein